MSERFVEILVKREIRDLVKEKKGSLSYNQFLKNIVDGNTMLVGGKLWKSSNTLTKNLQMQKQEQSNQN